MQEKNKPINKTHTVKSVGKPMPMDRLYSGNGGAVEAAPKQIVDTQLDLFKHGTPPKKDSLTDKELRSHLIASPTKKQHQNALAAGKKIIEEKKIEEANKKTVNSLTALKDWSQNPAAYQKKLADKKPERRDHFRHYQKTGELLKPTKEEIRRAKLPSAWDTIYDSMTPIEKGQWNREKRKKGWNGKTAEPLVKEFRSDSPDTYLSHPDQQKGMLLATLEDAKAKPKPKKINTYPEVRFAAMPVRDLNQEAREAALERTRAYAFSKIPDPDAGKGIGSFRNTIGRKLRASNSRTDWEKSNQRTYEDNTDAKE